MKYLPNTKPRLVGLVHLPMVDERLRTLYNVSIRFCIELTSILVSTSHTQRFIMPRVFGLMVRIWGLGSAMSCLSRYSVYTPPARANSLSDTENFLYLWHWKDDYAMHEWLMGELMIIIFVSQGSEVFDITLFPWGYKLIFSIISLIFKKNVIILTCNHVQ